MERDWDPGCPDWTTKAGSGTRYSASELLPSVADYGVLIWRGGLIARGWNRLEGPALVRDDRDGCSRDGLRDDAVLRGVMVVMGGPLVSAIPSGTLDGAA